MSGITEPTPLSNIDQLLEQINTLQQQLQAQAPGYERLLATIHKNLRADDKLVHMLSEEHIGTIIAGLGKHKNIIIAEATEKKPRKGKVTTSLDDLL